MNGTGAYTTIFASHDGVNLSCSDYNGTYVSLALNWNKTNGSITPVLSGSHTGTIADAWAITF